MDGPADAATALRPEAAANLRVSRSQHQTGLLRNGVGLLGIQGLNAYFMAATRGGIRHIGQHCRKHRTPNWVSGTNLHPALRHCLRVWLSAGKRHERKVPGSLWLALSRADRTLGRANEGQHLHLLSLLFVLGLLCSAASTDDHSNNLYRRTDGPYIHDRRRRRFPPLSLTLHPDGMAPICWSTVSRMQEAAARLGKGIHLQNR